MIRLATATDLTALVALEVELFGPDAWDHDAVRAELDGPGRRFVVAGADEVSGYAVSRAIGDVVDLQRIAVSPLWQRAGVATALLDDLVAHPGDADRMMLEVSAANDSAIAFYRHRGFTQIDTRRRYYRDGSDALVMTRPLDEDNRRSGRMDG